jgi:hypothetical protein
MIKLAQLLKEIEVVRPFSGRITNVTELEQYLDFLERKEGKGIYGNEFNREDLIKDYERYDTVSIPENIKSLYNLKYVEGDLSLIECKNITSLPNNLTVNTLYINNSNISEIPNNLNINGTLYCNNTPLLEQYSVNEIRRLITNNGGSVRHIDIKR